jgi:hypothetical protein
MQRRISFKSFTIHLNFCIENTLFLYTKFFEMLTIYLIFKCRDVVLAVKKQAHVDYIELHEYPERIYRTISHYSQAILYYITLNPSYI